MRLPSFLRTFYAFSNTTFHRAPTPFANATSLRPGTALRSISLPSIPFVGALFHTAESRKMSHPVQKSEQEWQAQLSPDQFRILREKGTEPPFSGDYDKHYPSSGTYACAGCSAPLYTADQKFKSGCGWPAFFDTVPGAVTRHVDRTFGMERIEIVCTNCGGHLGHVFKGEGYPTPTDERHCVNSVSLKFSNQDPVKEQTYDDYDNYEPRPRPRAHRPPPPDLDPYGPPPPGAIPVDSYHAPPPYPSSQRDGGRPPPPAGASDLPPPPMGEALKRRPSAMKREGSRSRVPNMRPEFPDEGSVAPDLERKTRRRDREFRDKRDGYESDEGETLRAAKPKRRGGGYDDDRGPPPARRGGRYDDEFDDRGPPPRRRKDDFDDYDDPPPRRRGGGRPVEYGSDPVPVKRRDTDGGRRPPPRSRRDDYSDSEDDYSRPPPPRRHRSYDDGKRRGGRDKYGDDRIYDSDDREDRDRRRRRQDIYDRDRAARRRDRSRGDRRGGGRYSDEYDSEDSYDRRDRRDRRRDRSRRGNRPPKEIKIGKYDIGPYVEKGQKHWGTVAPIVTPVVMNMAKKYLGGR
ncbi:hypothetical protein D0861_05279 [Hortaea werneckii]|uniref:MsrB domain-containing protein n=1 Tax=Hortaea werneckii TaxID=91943 RepID=A0A3M7FFJ8_HORWE|nr:hypothetical protein D0861_05279 [Hortaea werneckii]